MKKPTHGGPRKGAGRHPIEDKKITLTIYPRQSEVEAVGGKDKARQLALKAIQKG